jgi:hypothetical protein
MNEKQHNEDIAAEEDVKGDTYTHLLSQLQIKNQRIINSEITINNQQL